MKYIKLFENFEDKIDGIISECEDILLPLSDDGIYNEIFQHRYSYGRHDHNKNKGKYLVVQIGYEVDEDYFTYDDRSQFTFTHFTLDKYRDELNHLFSYLLENNFVFHYNLAYTDQQSNEFNINEFWNSLDMKLVSSNITFRYIG